MASSYLSYIHKQLSMLPQLPHTHNQGHTCTHTNDLHASAKGD